MRNHAHLDDHDLVLAADGELPVHRKAEVAAHLESCWSCRERMQSLQSTITDFVRARNYELNLQMPPAAGPRALLRARISEAAVKREPFSIGRLAAAFAAFAVVILAILAVFGSTVNAEGPKPQSVLTPS